MCCFALHACLLGRKPLITPLLPSLPFATHSHTHRFIVTVAGLQLGMVILAQQIGHQLPGHLGAETQNKAKEGMGRNVQRDGVNEAAGRVATE